MRLASFCARSSLSRLSALSPCRLTQARHLHFARPLPARLDPYRTLSVSRSASAAEIKLAYYRLAKQHHPDTATQPDIAAFQRVQEAYEVLTDPRKKRDFEAEDAFGGGMGVEGDDEDFDATFRSYAQSQSSGRRARSHEWFDDPADMFASIFGSWRQSQSTTAPKRKAKSSPQAPARGADLHATLELSFLDAINGASQSISYRCNEACSACSNTGKQAGGRKKACPACRGLGYSTEVRNHGRPLRHECDKCHGEGRVYPLCGDCHGTGVTKLEREVAVKIPAGIEHDTNLRLAGMGDAGRKGGPAGDLRLTIKVSGDSNAERGWRREGADIHGTVKIDLHTAILGGAITVDTVRGPQRVTLEPPIVHGHTVRVKGCGAQSASSSAPGDHVCHIHIELPSKQSLTSEQRKLFEQMKQRDKADADAGADTADQRAATNTRASEPSQQSDSTTSQRLETTRQTRPAADKQQAAPRVRNFGDADFADVYETDDGVYTVEFEFDDDGDDLFVGQATRRRRRRRQRQKSKS